MRLRPEALEWVVVEDEIVALDMVSSTYLAANPTGSRLWESLSTGATRESLVDDLVTAYGIDPARAEEDVDSFLAELRRRGLIEE